MKWAVDHGHQQVQVRADSELLVKQMRGEYKVKHPGLQPLAARARLLIGQLDDVTFQHVRREQNKEADRLSNLGMDQAEAALREKPQGAGSAAAVLDHELFSARITPTIRPACVPRTR